MKWSSKRETRNYFGGKMTKRRVIGVRGGGNWGGNLAEWTGGCNRGGDRLVIPLSPTYESVRGSHANKGRQRKR